MHLLPAFQRRVWQLWCTGFFTWSSLGVPHSVTQAFHQSFRHKLGSGVCFIYVHVQWSCWFGKYSKPGKVVSTRPVKVTCNIHSSWQDGEAALLSSCTSDQTPLTHHLTHYGILKIHRRGPVCSHHFLLVFTMLLRAAFGRGTKICLKSENSFPDCFCFVWISCTLIGNALNQHKALAEKLHLTTFPTQIAWVSYLQPHRLLSWLMSVIS